MRTISHLPINSKPLLIAMWCFGVVLLCLLPQVQVESGHMATVISFSLMLWLALAQYYQAQQALWTQQQWAQKVMRVMRANALLLTYAYLILTLACIQDDFSVRYVWQNVHEQLPWWYKPAVPWAAHEGSWLLWWLLLSLYSYAYLAMNKNSINHLSAAIQATAQLHIGFGAYALLASNAFTRILPIPPPSGMDLNPLLQDPGFLIHPPCLYIGYVSFVIPYIMSVQYIHKPSDLTKAWLTKLRPWVLWTWSWLTLGIGLGSWWAYRELGWGGWWFWDPVENVSLMPWICATILLHTAYQQTKQGVAWAVGISIIGFILSVLGTLMIRSGLLVSVHSFVSDPLRGAVLMVLTSVLIAKVLPAMYRFYRYHTQSLPNKPHALGSLLQLQAQLLATILLVVLVATVYPMLHETWYQSSVSVGAGYYEQVLSPLVVVLTALLAVYPYRGGLIMNPRGVVLRLALIATMGILFDQLTATIFQGSTNYLLVSMHILSLWVIDTHIRLAKQRSCVLSPSVHILITLLLLSMIINKHYERSWMIELHPKTTQAFDGYTLKIGSIKESQAFNYQQQQVGIEISNRRHEFIRLDPSLQYYPNRDTTQAKVAIASTVWGDWLVALARPTAKGPLLLRVYQKPLQSWLWLSTVLLAVLGIYQSVRRLYALGSK